jgi:hypothetical protein
MSAAFDHAGLDATWAMAHPALGDAFEQLFATLQRPRHVRCFAGDRHPVGQHLLAGGGEADPARQPTVSPEGTLFEPKCERSLSRK